MIFEKLKSRHVLIFDVDHDEIQKKMKLFGFVSTKQKWRLKRHLSLEGYTFNLVPRELSSLWIFKDFSVLFRSVHGSLIFIPLYALCDTLAGETPK